MDMGMVLSPATTRYNYALALQIRQPFQTLRLISIFQLGDSLSSAYDKKLTLTGHDVPTKCPELSINIQLDIASVCILTSTSVLTNKINNDQTYAIIGRCQAVIISSTCPHQIW